MSGVPGERPLLLVVGGCSGLVGRAVLAEFARDHRIRSVHRRPTGTEATAKVDVRPLDVAADLDWGPYLDGVDTVLNLAWYRQARRRRFVRLADGLVRLVRAAEAAGVRRFVHVSVPDAPPRLETDLPYLAQKRRVDRTVEASRLDYVIVRPTMLFGPRDVLLSVMLRTMRRYHRFPMFGDGEYHVSPVSVTDVASVLRREAAEGGRRNVTVGGPRRWRYRDLTDELFRVAGLPPKYFHLGPANSVRLAALLETLGSSLIYAYEVEWLLSDMLGLPPYVGLERPLADVGPFLQGLVRGREGGPSQGGSERSIP
ncbi:MAG TPA: NAD(P)H-binding protein [Thermoplasmata archaeon]|nr:NAD(P)H-binding protein [Thermoplasmata archaeon]